VRPAEDAVAVRCLFASDLHGRIDRYQKLLGTVERERPAVLLLGGDLLPGGALAHAAAPPSDGGFLVDELGPRLERLREQLGGAYPRVLAILGNDDPRTAAAGLERLAARGLLEHVHGRNVAVGGLTVYGYACVPPTPFLLKDWERYDVSRYVEPGCVSPEEGWRTVPEPANLIRFGTIARDLAALAGDDDLARAVFLFHAPPHDTALDRAALDGVTVEHVQVDVHVGSIAIRRFIEARQPALTLHGHVHESARLTGAWRDRIGATVTLSAAHDGPELALVRFDPEDPAAATRELL
jgi:Icc-related predicted phosphoesterase